MSNKQNPVQKPEIHRTAAQQKAADLSDQFDAFEEMLLKNWKIFIGAFALILVVVLIVLITTSIQEKRDIAAKTALNNAQDEQTLVQAIEKYDSHPAAVSAQFRLADIYTGKQDYQKASENLAQIADNSDLDLFFRAKATVSRAYLLDKSGNKDEALKVFNTISSNANVDAVLRAEAAYAQAGIYFGQKDYAKVRSALANINVAKMDSQMDLAYARWAEKASVMLSRLPAENEAAAESK